MPSTNVPQVQSYEQILSSMLSSYAASQGISDYNTGSAVLSFFEVVALMVARSSGDVFQILTNASIDYATGSALQNLAIQNGLTIISATPATGYINVIDTSFQKISTNIYAGQPAPNVGTTVIYVSNASSFPASGSVYLGRGTPNVEGPLAYSTAPVQTGNYWTITLNVPTTKFHNLGESVILAQKGIRTIPVNTTVVAPAVGSNPAISYSVTTAGTILDGETTVTNIPIVAQLPGTNGNVPIGSITTFSSPPFPSATCTNTSPLTSGLNNETDDQLRARIKLALASTGLGTATAVLSSLIGATAPDSQSTIVSDNLLQTSYGALVVIDNGTGYEATSTGVGLETIVASAIGGEQFFQLATGGSQAPVAKAFLQSNNSPPYAVKGGDTLAVIIGGVTYQHTFSTSDFLSPGAATAYELAASINSDVSIVFEATTANGGNNLVISYNSEGNDSIQITTPTVGDGVDASIAIGFPSSQVETLRLYKNNLPLSKNGNTATVYTQAQTLWSSAITNGDTLVLGVDGTAEITYTITNADFIATGLYTNVNSTNSLASWVQVFNNILTGVTAEVIGNTISLTSNLGASNRAAVVIDPSSTLVTKGMFTDAAGLSSKGAASDYVLDRNTAQIELVTPLSAGDNLTAGSNLTQASIKTAAISTGSVTLSAEGYFWLLIDNPGKIITTGVVSNTTLSVSTPATNTIRYTSNITNAFSNVEVGDYVIAWSPQLAVGNRLEGRAHAVTATTLDLLITPAEYANVSPNTGFIFNTGFVVLRSTKAPQKFSVPSGTSTLDALAISLQAQTQSLVFSVSQEEYLVISSNTLSTVGSVLMVTFDSQAQQLQFTAGDSSISQESLLAFYDSQQSDAQFPLFIHTTVASPTYASPPDSNISSFSSYVPLDSANPNNLISFLQPYGGIADEQPAGDFVQETTVSGTTVGITALNTVRRLRTNDRFFVASPLDFGNNDSVNITLDSNPTTENFTIPLYRLAVTNTSLAVNSTNFNAYDSAAGANATFASSFGSGYSFANFKALMQAKKTLKPTPSQTAILYRSAAWGRSGQYINVGYSYPSAPNTAIGSAVTIGESVQILINLASGVSVPTAIAASTEWNITITPNTPSAGIDQVTWTYNGTGTSPGLTLSGGEYVNIGTQTEANVANTGIFRVSTQSGFLPSSTSFTVQMEHGVAVAQTNVATLSPNAIVFYEASPTTAAQIQTYVAANLSKYVTATLVNDGGTTGSGIIVLSTFEDSGFTYSTVQLQDGINWIASSNLGSSPQFTLKLPLSLPTDVGYAFNNGEDIYLIPTTMEQVQSFTSVLAVSGFTTAGTISLVDRASKLELATDTVGSAGSIQIIGGLANECTTPVIDSASRVDNSVMEILVNSIAGQGILSDNWFRLQATTAQNKTTGFAANTSVNIISADPISGQATIQLLNKDLNQRYFGKPRSYIRSMGDTFLIENQGTLVCLSWDSTSGSSPVFNKAALNFNDSAGGTFNVYKVPGTTNMQFDILSGNANFSELSIGGLITISGSNFAAANTGTFLVTGVSDNGTSLQVFNENGVSQYSFGTITLNTNLTAGDTVTIGSTALVAGTNFAIGGTASATAINLSAIAGTVPGVSSTVSGSVVTVTATSADANIALSYSGVGSVTLSGSQLSGVSFSSGNFTASSSVSEGDTLILSSPFNVLNQGQFRVIRRYNDSVWFENPDAIREEVELPYNPVNLGFDATTSFMVNASNHTQKLIWNGTGTQPHLENANVGDIVTFGTDFNSSNQGSFMVLDSGAALPQIANIVLPAGGQFASSGAGQYFLIYSAGNINQYYVWFNVNSGNTDPAIVGYTGLQINILSGDTATSVASKTQAVVGVATGLSATSSGSTLTVTTIGSQATNPPSNGNIPSPFSVSVTQYGQRTFLECINPSAVNQSSVYVATSTLTDHRPQMQFYEYDATIPGDSLVITSNNFLASNVGTWPITQVINRNTAIVTGNLASVTNVSLSNIVSSFFVQEGVPYSGYKRVKFVVAEPGSTTLNSVTLTTNAQYDKINESAGVELTSLNKLNFSTVFRNGLDSYRYNTGLIREANKIIYGDPTDNVTYPGVGAAGADIFLQGPLVKRIQVALAVRLQTGVPFAAMVSQVQNAVTSLVNSNPVGKSIAISSIVSTVGAIPGILSVSVSSPTYNIANDLITLTQLEKAYIIDPNSDVVVTSIGG